ncbi:MAG: class I SAM-dependent methyltransferase [Alphaproteobacteria bacterium]
MMGLATVLGIKPLGFFIPYRYAAGVRSSARQCYPACEELFEGARPNFHAVIAEIDNHAAALRAIARAGDSGSGASPTFRQDWFPRLDAAAAYAMVRRFRPRRIVEVGSGHSTRFLARAVADAGLESRMTAIDPAPRTAIGALAIEVVESTLQEAGRGPFEDLAAGDFLVIDSSHILMPGSDVDIVLNTILPMAPAGVLVHFHDIFLPDAYPREWDWRAYNEQNAVAALLLGGDGYEVMFASHYVATRLVNLLAATVLAEIEMPKAAFEGSLWLRKR